MEDRFVHELRKYQVAFNTSIEELVYLQQGPELFFDSQFILRNRVLVSWLELMDRKIAYSYQDYLYSLLIPWLKENFQTLNLYRVEYDRDTFPSPLVVKDAMGPLFSIHLDRSLITIETSPRVKQLMERVLELQRERTKIWVQMKIAQTQSTHPTFNQNAWGTFMGAFRKDKKRMFYAQEYERIKEEYDYKTRVLDIEMEELRKESVLSYSENKAFHVLLSKMKARLHLYETSNVEKDRVNFLKKLERLEKEAEKEFNEIVENHD